MNRSRFPSAAPVGRVIAPVVALAVALALPAFCSDYMVRLLSTAAIASIAVLGLNLVFGYAGLISLGQAAFIGIGAYTVAILTTEAGWSPWFASAVAVALCGAFAYVVGIVLLRLKGHYLALATLGLNVSFGIVVSNWTDLTGGTDGIAGIPSLSIGSFPLDTDARLYAFATIVLVALGVLTRTIRTSHLGRSMIAVNDDEMAAGISGIDVTRAKAAAFAVGGAFAGVSGCLFAVHARFVSPDDFSYVQSILYLSMLVVGGAGSIVGAVIGAAGVTLLPELLRGAGNAYLLIFGLLVLLVLIVLPDGLVSLARLPVFRRRERSPRLDPIAEEE